MYFTGMIKVMSDKPKILLVDDELEIVEFLKGVIDGAGYECVGVSSPVEAINLAKEESFAAIVSDVRMPVMNGVEMISQIKKSAHNANTPVVVLSGALTEEMALRLERLGIIDVMSKPPEMDILLKIIERAARNRTKNTGRHYNPLIKQIFSEAFASAVKNHLTDQITLSEAVINERPLTNIEYCGMVTFVGRRVSGVMSVSYQAGFTAEFARVIMGGDIAGLQLDIFEASAGELAEQVAQQVVSRMKAELGLLVEVWAPLVVHGRYAANPLPATQPRALSTADLNGKKCYMEFALVDLDQEFLGQMDSKSSQVFSA
jgi:DNA-binding response OmpR family regulator